MKAIIIFILCLQAICLQAQDTLTLRVYFACNSAKPTEKSAQDLYALEGVEILSVDAYASAEGNISKNLSLSEARGHLVSSVVDFRYTAYGATELFGSSRGANRVVVVTYVTAAKTTSTINAEGIVVETTTPSDIEGFTCGQRVDPSIYFADTLSESIAVDTAAIEVPAPIVLETVTPVLTLNAGQAALSVLPIPVDTLFLPTRQAVRFQMREHGLTRSQAIKSIEARKPQWKHIPKKGKARKRLPRKTKGKNDSVWSHLFPFRGC